MKKPLISVIIPVYNGERYLADAIGSVLSQTYSSVELIVADDGSTDRTAEIVSHFCNRLYYLPCKHAGFGATLNRGIAAATGRYLAFLDADDLWMERKLELQIKAITEKDVNMVFGHIQQFISPELDDEDKDKFVYKAAPMPAYCSSTIMVSKELFYKIGEFTTEYPAGEFIEWFMRAKDLGVTIHLLPDIIAKRRLHLHNTTRILRQQKNHINYARILKAGINRRRATNNKK